MKQRIISGAVILLITIACVISPNNILKAFLCFVMAYGCYEAIKAQNKKFNLLVYLVMVATCFSIFFFNNLSYLSIIVELIVLMIIAVFNANTSISDMAMVLLMSVIIGFGCYYMSYIQAINKMMLAYVIIICYLSDVFALFIGMKFGKHKLNERVSPKKTIEGSVGGLIFGFGISLIWAIIFNYFNYDKLIIIVCSILLPIVSEIGDLVFSLFKRYYNIKDFSNLIPGHGGLLDRLDSLLFCIILFGAILTTIK